MYMRLRLHIFSETETIDREKDRETCRIRTGRKERTVTSARVE